MGIDNSNGLKEGVKDGGADKAHPPLGKIGRKLVGKGRACTVEVIDNGSVPEAQKILTEAAELLLKLQKHLRILDCGQNFPAVSDDSTVLKQRIHLISRVIGNDLGIEAVKSLPEVFSLIQYTLPG